MRETFLKTIGGVAFAILLSVFAPVWVSAQGKGEEQSDEQTQEDSSKRRRNARALEGTWDVQVTLRNCQTGAEIRTFPELTTFMFGGTMLDSTSGISQALKTPGQGVWSHVTGHIYRFSFKSLNFNAGGTFTGSTRVTHEAVLNSNATEYTSVGNAEVYDPNGNLIFTGCSTTTATRFE